MREFGSWIVIGVFRFKSFFYSLCKRVGDQNVTAPLKLIWKAKVPPRVAFFTWEAARDSILTIDMLKRK